MRGNRLGVSAQSLVVTLVGIAALTLGFLSSPVGASSSLRSFTIQASEFSFRAPASVPAGWTRITIKNIGGEDHQAQIARLNPGVSFGQLQAAAAKSEPGAVVSLVTPVGGPNAVAPGKSAATIDNLTPGQYALICFLFSQDGSEHDAKGMVKALTVTPSRTRTNAPKPFATVGLRDFSFVFPSKVPGTGIVAVKNSGSQDHEMAIYRLDAGKTLADAKSFLITRPGTAPPIPAPGAFVGGIAGVAPGATGYVDLNLRPATYVAVCFFPDPTKNGLPHIAEGMIQQFTVR
jgi:hypothetical protein